MKYLKKTFLAGTVVLYLLTSFDLSAQIDPQVFSQMEFRFVGPEGN